ncbi:dnaJ homolog subfamily C member 14 isoform 1-T2 [Discoglossus pictus]
MEKEKQMRGGTANNTNTASIQSCSVETQKSNGTHFSMTKNSLNLSKDMKISAEQNGTSMTSGGCVDSEFDVHRHNCFQGAGECDVTQDHFGKAGDLWTKEYFSGDVSEEDLAAGSSESSDHQPMPEAAGCLGCELPPSVQSKCGCAGENLGPSGATYSDIGDHTCSRGCHHFSSYQQRPLDGEGCEDEDSGRRMEAEEDSYKGTSGRRGGRRSKNRTSAREEFRRDGRQPPSFGGKHKNGRKKSQGEGRHQVRSVIPQPLMQLSTFLVTLLIDLVHWIGEYVEALGTLLYSRVWLPAHDLGNLKSQLWSFAHWTRLRAKYSWILTCSFGLWLLRMLKILSALLFLLLMLAVGCARLCWQYIKRAVGRVGGDSKIGSQISLALHRVWTSVTQNRTCSRLFSQLKSWTAKLRADKRTSWTSAASTSAGTGRYPPGEEVERLLTMVDIPEEDLNPFQVLGVEMNASDTELKKAYRQLAVLVHPDKNNHPRAEEAFKVLRAAWDTVSNPEKRKEYEMKRMSETELAKSMNEFLTKLQDDLKEAMNSMMCSKCQGKHRRFEMDRDPANARYCAECGKMHPAEEGDFWAESSMLGLKITYFAMMQGKVFDITEWAGCQRVGISPDTHRVPYHISFGSRNPTNPGRQRTPSESNPTSVADLQNLLHRIFQGSPGPMPNGNMFTPPQQSPPGAQSPPGPAKPESVPRSDTKSKRKKKVRRPLQR